jgi:alpha-L-fucosidase
MEMVNDIQPNVLMNSRIGGGYGHFQTAIDHGMMPAVNTKGWIDGLKVPWQTHDSVSGPWGYASHKPQFHNDPNRSAKQYIYSLTDIVSKGGVLLLNIAPNEKGIVPIGQANVLRRFGEWLDVYGEAIYDAAPSPIRNPDLPITSKPGKLYFHVERQSEPNLEVKGILTTIARAYLLNDPTQQVPFTQDGDVINFELPSSTFEGAQGVGVIAADYVGEMAVSDPTLTPDDNGVIKLPVSKSRYSKIRMSYDKRFGSTHKLAMPWDTGGNTIIWEMRVSEPGTYKVVSHQAFPPGLKGAGYSVRVNEQVLDADPVVTEHGRDFVPVEMGTVSFDQPDDYELRVVMLDGARNSGEKFKKTRFIREFSIQSIELQKL